MSTQEQSGLSAAKQALLAKRLRGKKSESMSNSKEQHSIQRRKTAGVIPLSFPQQRLWFLDQLDAGLSSAYNVPFVWRMSGTLQTEVLQRSVDEMVRRHESLRTTFMLDEENGQPLQVISSKQEIRIAYTDLRAVEESERERQAQCLIAREVNAPFDLARGPLMRVKLLQVADEEYLLVLNLHHIISDGWSIGVVTKELAALYNAYRQGRPSPLPELPLQYADYALWQRERLQEEVLERQLPYWQRKLSGTLPVLELPADRPRPVRQTIRGAEVKFRISSDLTGQLKKLSQREGATLFMTLMAALKTLLHRYTGQEDIVIGSPIANRNRSEIENIIGFFVNTLVFRTDVNGNQTFGELIARVRETALEAYAHQDVPFEKLVEVLQPDRDLSQSPLFGVLFVLVNTPLEPLQFDQLTLTPEEPENETAKFDLSLIMTEEEGCLQGCFEYNADLFDVQTIERLTWHFQTLLQTAVAAPHLPLSELPIMREEERDLILREWNRTEEPYDEELRVHDLFERQVLQTPDRVAVCFGGESLTYRQLDRQASRLADRLQSLGVGPNVLVGLCLPRSLEMVTAVLAILKAGGAYVALDPAYPEQRLLTIVEEARMPLLLTEEKLAPLFAGHPTQIILYSQEEHGEAQVIRHTNAEHLAYVLYTSGSTGKPKGVAMPHRPLVNLLLWQQRVAKAPGSRTLQYTSLNFDVSFQEIFSTLCFGGTLVLVSEEVRRDSRDLLLYLSEQCVERLFLPFVALQHLAEVAETIEAQSLSLREVITAGEQLQITRSVVRFFEQLPDCVLQNQYGPSESHVVTQYTCEGPPAAWPALPPLGRPISNAKVYVLDGAGHPVPVGVSGELYIGGISQARGYLYREDLTDERFVSHPLVGEDGGRLYKTGDLVRYAPDGQLLYLGRIDQQVKIRGHRVELGEIESLLGLHPDVQEAVVVVKADERVGKRLIAYTVLQERSECSPAHLRQYMKEKVPDYMVPAVFVQIESLPQTPNGKVDRRVLSAMWVRRDQEQEHPYLAPRTRKELEMVQVWEDVLQVRPIGVLDNFFAAGGESLKAVSLIVAIRKRFGVELPVSALFAAPTVADLTQQIEASGELVREDQLILIQKGDLSSPPLFLIHPGWGGVLCYAPLASALGAKQTVYGLQATGYDSDADSLDDILEMAELYTEKIRQADPSGPYCLAGWSFGGTVAFEIARRLEATGAKVEFVGLIDAPFLGVEEPEQAEDLSDKRYLLNEYAKQWLTKEALPPSVLNLFDQKGAEDYVLKQMLESGARPSGFTVQMLRREIKVMAAHTVAQGNYRATGTVRADLHLFYATEISEEQPFPLVDLSMWMGRTTGRFCTQAVAGHHHSVIRPPHVQELANGFRAVLGQKALT